MIGNLDKIESRSKEIQWPGNAISEVHSQSSLPYTRRRIEHEAEENKNKIRSHRLADFEDIRFHASMSKSITYPSVHFDSCRIYLVAFSEGSL